MKTLLAIHEESAVKSLGLKKKLTKLECLKILIHPNLSLPEPSDSSAAVVNPDPDKPNIRSLLIDTCLLAFSMPYLLDFLIASFFFAYSYLKLLQVTYITETLYEFTQTHIETIQNTDGFNE